MRTLLWTFLIIALIHPFITVAAALHTSISCQNTSWVDHPDPNDCIWLLQDMSRFPWVHQDVIFGDLLPFPGRTPFIFTARTCQLHMDTISGTSRRFQESFKLVEYFSEIYKIVDQCLRSTSEAKEGFVHVAKTRRFLVALGGTVHV